MIIIAATVLLLLSAAALGIGYMITGKQKLHKKCGSLPVDKKKGCGSGGCSSCEKK